MLICNGLANWINSIATTQHKSHRLLLPEQEHLATTNPISCVTHLAVENACSSAKVCQLDQQHCDHYKSHRVLFFGDEKTLQLPAHFIHISHTWPFIFLLLSKGLPTGSTALPALQNKSHRLLCSERGNPATTSPLHSNFTHVAVQDALSFAKACQLDQQPHCQHKSHPLLFLEREKPCNCQSILSHFTHLAVENACSSARV